MILNEEDDEGNAAELNFGKEFATADCLANDELYPLLQIEASKAKSKVGSHVTTEYENLLLVLLR